MFAAVSATVLAAVSAPVFAAERALAGSGAQLA
jgi:hypothetical protein